jgi:hypothetical protein
MTPAMTPAPASSGPTAAATPNEVPAQTDNDAAAPAPKPAIPASDATQSTAVFDNAATMQAPRHAHHGGNAVRTTDSRAKPQAASSPAALSSPGETITAELSAAAPIPHAATREGNSP